MGQKPLRVSVCIATHRRPAGLRRLLRSLAAVDIAADRAAVRVIVVDNTAEAPEITAAAELREVAQWPLELCHEPRRGIPFARNAAVRAAIDNADILVFVDDDEVVTPSWLTELLDCRERHRADVVVGPVIPVLPPQAPQWVHKGRFHEQPRLPTGAPMATAPTNNTAVDASWFHRLDRWFDESMAFTGGTDTELFLRLADAGARIVWCDEAEVWEHVPVERTTVGWIVRRSYRLGVSEGTMLRRRTNLRTGGGVIRILKSLGHIAVGGLRGLVGGIRGKHAFVTGVREAAWGAGWLLGIAGRSYEEYR